MSELSGRHLLSDLLECAGLAKSSYYYALSHPKAPTRPELWEAAAEIFSRTPNGCGHRQIAMCLRAELDARIADKTVLKMIREMGIGCGIRRETDYHRYSSYRGVVGKTFENVVGRDFSAAAPWQKMGTDVTKFKQPWGMIPSMYFSPIAQTDRPRVRKCIFTNRANGPSPLPVSRRPSSPAAGPSACTTCP